MGFRSDFTAPALAVIAVSLASSCAQTTKSASATGRFPATKLSHRVAVIEGDVQAGQAFERPIGNGLKILLEPIVSGWVLRVVPAQSPRGPHDYAELATPPYQSVSPLLISTDFSFRAQDALAWNPRHFRFAANSASFSALLAAYEQSQRLTKAGPASAAGLHVAESRLADLVSREPEGALTILDAHLVQGTADQTPAAAMVALHPNASARQVDQPANGVATPLGRLNWLRFRVRLDLPPGFSADKSVRMERSGSF